jgi:O-antigen ligase
VRAALRRPGLRTGSPDRDLALRLLCGAGLLVPPGIVETRPPSVVVDDPLTLVTAVRGGLPVLCLVLVLVLARPTLRPLGVREHLLAGYLLVVLASTVWSLAPSATFLKAGHLVVAYALLVVLARTWADRRAALDDLAVVAWTVVLLAAAGAGLLSDRTLRPTGGRLLSVYPHLEPVVLGMVAAVAVLMALGAAGPALLRRRLPRVVLGSVSLAVLLLTGSRGGLALCLVGVLTMAALGALRRPRPLTAVGLLAGLVLLVLSPLGATLRARLSPSLVAEHVGNLGGRLPMWGDAWATASESPLVGFGYYAGHRLGRYAELFEERFGVLITAYGTVQTPYVDGTWVETLLDVGAVGVLALAAFVAGSAVLVWRSRHSAGGALHLALVVVFVLYSVQDFTLQQVGYPMFFFGGLLLAPLVVARAASERCTPSAAQRETDV